MRAPDDPRYLCRDVTVMAARWYVYKLVDPTTQTAFYVGKGSGKRMYEHEADAARGVCSAKCSKIRQITSAGLEVIKEQVALFWDEQAAYDFETDLIAEFGLDNLTNILPGGQMAWERRRIERSARLTVPVDWTPASALQAMRDFAGGKHSGHIWFREWVRGGNLGKLKVEVDVPQSAGKFAQVQAWIVGKLLNDSFPEMFKVAASDKAQHPALADLFKPFGVDLRFDYGR